MSDLVSWRKEANNRPKSGAVARPVSAKCGDESSHASRGKNKSSRFCRQKQNMTVRSDEDDVYMANRSVLLKIKKD